jgi:hypothetical protein
MNRIHTQFVRFNRSRQDSNSKIQYNAMQYDTHASSPQVPPLVQNRWPLLVAVLEQNAVASDWQ